MRTKHFTFMLTTSNQGRSQLARHAKTHRLINLLDIYYDLTKRVRIFLRDTTDFLIRLPSEISENTLLVSFDVQSLYLIIPHQLRGKAINYWLRKFPNNWPARFPKNFILDGMNFIFTNNTFCFNRNTIVKPKVRQWAPNLPLCTPPWL